MQWKLVEEGNGTGSGFLRLVFVELEWSLDQAAKFSGWSGRRALADEDGRDWIQEQND
jgi:hypothetical protein